MTSYELIEKYIETLNDCAFEHKYGDIDENEETQYWRHVNKLRRKLYRALTKIEKQVVKLLENEPKPVYFPEDWDDACQEREEWSWEYNDACNKMYAIRVVLGLKRMNAREWYHQYKTKQKNHGKN